jgi:hypothetical protein
MRALDNAGMIKAAKIAMMAITTSNSISVNPARFVLFGFVGIYQNDNPLSNLYNDPAASSKTICGRPFTGFRDDWGS